MAYRDMISSGPTRAAWKEPNLRPRARIPIGCRSGPRKLAFQPLLDVAPRSGADLLRDRLAILEQQHGGDAADAVAARGVRILVDVDLGNGHLVTTVGGDFLQRR